MKKGVKGLFYSIFIAIVAIAYFGANLIISDANDKMYNLDNSRSISINYKSNCYEIHIKYSVNGDEWIDAKMEDDSEKDNMFVYNVNIPENGRVKVYFYDDFGNIDNNNGRYYYFNENVNYCNGNL